MRYVSEEERRRRAKVREMKEFSEEALEDWRERLRAEGMSDKAAEIWIEFWRQDKREYLKEIALPMRRVRKGDFWFYTCSSDEWADGVAEPLDEE